MLSYAILYGMISAKVLQLMATVVPELAMQTLSVWTHRICFATRLAVAEAVIVARSLVKSAPQNKFLNRGSAVQKMGLIKQEVVEESVIEGVGAVRGR